MNSNPTPDRRAEISAHLWRIAEQHIVAEWICCEPLEPGHDLCAKGYAALGMVKALLVDSDPDKAWNPAAPVLDAVMQLHDPAAPPSVSAVDQTTRDRIAEAPAVWIDGHPQLEAIAAAVWERCRTEDTSLVVDDPRNIGVAALAAMLAVLPPAADRATLRAAFGRVLRHWGLLDEQIDQKAAEEFAVTDLLALLPEQTNRDAEIEHLRDRLASCRERVGVAAEKAIAAEDAIECARQACRRLTSALIAVEPLLAKPYPDDPRWTPWTRFVRPALKELGEALRTGPAAHDPSLLVVADAEQAVLPPTADRAAVLRETADRYEEILARANTGQDPRYWTAVRDITLGLRRLADEAQQPAVGARQPDTETPTVVPPPALTEVGRLRAQVEALQQDAERDRGLAKVGARCMREGHQGLIESGRAVVEGWRFALSTGLGLGTGAPWEAIHERVKELAAASSAVPGRSAATSTDEETSRG